MNITSNQRSEANPFLPFTEPIKPHVSPKDVKDTSVDVYRQLNDDGTIDRRKRLVLESLDAHIRERGFPTARELHRSMQRQGLVSGDPNSIKPRITELKNDGLIEFADKRACAVTAKKVYVLKITQRATLILEHWRRQAQKRG
jgi:hypothetical protein